MSKTEAAPQATPPAAQAPATVPAAGAPVPAPQAPMGGQMSVAPSASLYVGDLNPEVTEAMLFEKFNEVGQVASIRVCRDSITRRSLGYAYVNFVNAADAERAMEEFNYDPIAGRPCRIMWSQRDPSVRRSGVGNIFIKNLHKDIDNKVLYDTLIPFGNILSCKVVTDRETGESRGYGFIHFETQKEADEAITKVNGMEIMNMQVYVGPFKTKAERMDDIAKSQANFTNLFVKNFPLDMTEEGFEEMFTPFGKITSRKIMAANEEDAEGKSRGFGFVAFETNEAAVKAIEALNGKEVEGQKNPLYVGRFQKKAERVNQLRRAYEARKQENQLRYQGVNLYVKNLEDSVTDEQIRTRFAEFGQITSAKVMKDEKGTSRGFGFVCFSSQDEATKAVTEMNGQLMGSKPLYVALAQRKDERKQQLAMQYNRAQAVRMQSMFQGQAGMQAMYAMPPVMPAVQQQPRGGFYQQMRPGGARFAMQQTPQMIALSQQYRPAMSGVPMGGGPQNQRMMQAGRGGGQSRRANQPKGQGFRGQRGAQMPMMMTQPGPMVPMGAPSQQQPTQLAQAPGQEPLTASALASASNQEQKQMLGERLFPLIQKPYPELAGKITGMLLEMDNSELLHLLEDETALKTKVEEAVSVLMDHARSTGAPIGNVADTPAAE
mmetsp:Transcript_21503/g.56050  ORF Transcript_21503/g.56050 Transcript_21503/m.56050 type:complete len:661 (-) Transcript_21503:121-2103(-)